jgi:hypothetical protein
MPKKTKIDKLPPDIKELIGRLREQGRTLDEILAKLQELEIDIARSTLARGLNKWEKHGERMREAKELSKFLISKGGDPQENELLQLNINLLHPAILQLMDPDGSMDPKDAMLLSTAIKNLATAQATDSARTLRERKELKQKITKAIDGVEKEAATGETPASAEDVLKRIREEVYGIFDKPQ